MAWFKKRYFTCVSYTKKTDNQQWLKKLTLLHFSTSVQKRNNEFTFNGKA